MLTKKINFKRKIQQIPATAYQNEEYKNKKQKKTE